MTRYLTKKILLVGSSQVGKTSFLGYLNNRSRSLEDTSDTIGVDFSLSKISLDDDLICTLQFWDIKGTDLFRRFVRPYCRGSCGCLLFFDMSNYASFSDLHEWINIIRSVVRNIPIILIGAKSDQRFEVTPEDVSNLIQNFNLDGFFLTSIILGFNIEEILEDLTIKTMSQQAVTLENDAENYRFDLIETHEYITEEEKYLFHKFLKFFSICPVCNNENHENYLRAFFLEEDPNKAALKQRLLSLMSESRSFDDLYSNKISVGIPCCNCFKLFFQEE
jgi:small GTP-binding protein